MLSERAQTLLTEASATRPKVPSAKEVRSFLQEIDVRAAEPFVECICTVGGLEFRDPFHFLYFYSLDEIRTTPNARRRYFEYASGAWWFSCVESQYPGYCFMHQSGSLHYECDPSVVWAPCLPKVIEGHAFLTPLNSATELHQLVASVNVKSLDELLTITGALLDEAASHPYAAYCRWKGGAIVVLNVSTLASTGRCAVWGYLHSVHAARELSSRIESIATVREVRQLRKSSSERGAFWEGR